MQSIACAISRGAVSATGPAKRDDGATDDEYDGWPIVEYLRYLQCAPVRLKQAVVLRSLDHALLKSRYFWDIPARPILIKCDVEGAELMVLDGARHLLTSHHPALLLSVHHSMLPDYESIKEDVAKFLEALGYIIDIVSIDHEEHWWCRWRTIN